MSRGVGSVTNYEFEQAEHMDLKLIRVLVADDDCDFSAGVVALLDAVQFVDVVGIASNGREAIVAVKKDQPDIVLMDVRMPEFDGLLATKFLSEISPTTRIIVVSSTTERGQVKRMLEAGASGHVAKSRARTDIIAAIEAVTDEQLFMSPNIDSSVLRDMN